MKKKDNKMEPKWIAFCIAAVIFWALGFIAGYHAAPQPAKGEIGTATSTGGPHIMTMDEAATYRGPTCPEPIPDGLYDCKNKKGEQDECMRYRTVQAPCPRK